VRARSYDSLALEVLLAPVSERTRQRALSALARQARVTHGSECPSCGNRDDVEDNGATRAQERTYLCPSCGHQWDEVPV
jgi:transposase-like protein